MSYKDFQKELHTIGEKLWLKLQRLPRAEPLEIVSFFVIVLFIVTILSMMIIACSCCCTRCCSGSPKPKGRRIQVQPAGHA
ncbi:small integral membrane protein 5 [Varanus komodoensis]|uniref:small integral membrane protein 5 n=1 Tax=Varanus komodoensis TaxID=61221 RepID=UPI001CF776B7|nr:small integral membrane protein 5 [Varanus komodoensis]XP_044309607.1 small integral membrane protein 5 [Varanus komodoensis]XP_044309608.1 small integral membrane protein 5 [Varanus komodoensis]